MQLIEIENSTDSKTVPSVSPPAAGLPSYRLPEGNWERDDIFYMRTKRLHRIECVPDKDIPPYAFPIVWYACGNSESVCMAVENLFGHPPYVDMAIWTVLNFGHRFLFGSNGEYRMTRIQHVSSRKICKIKMLYAHRTLTVEHKGRKEWSGGQRERGREREEIEKDEKNCCTATIDAVGAIENASTWFYFFHRGQWILERLCRCSWIIKWKEKKDGKRTHGYKVI